MEAAAERCGVVLALENLRHAAHLHAALSALTGPFTRFCYDSGHHFGWGKGEPYLERYGSRLAALHLHDNDGTRDQHLLPFDGAVDWARPHGPAGATGYDGSLTLEVQAFGRYERAMSASAFLERAHAALGGCMPAGLRPHVYSACPSGMASRRRISRPNSRLNTSVDTAAPRRSAAGSA